jgi:O-antigen ligase
MGHLILAAILLGWVWLIRKDTARRGNLSPALWIPTLWLGIICSRPVSVWLGGSPASSDPSYSLEGSPADRNFFLVMILASLFVLWRRGISWGKVARKNWPVFVFYGYLLLSTLWADSTIVSAKRWIKEAGNIAVVLVILSETNPEQAFRAVFSRCAYLLFPLSILFIRYIPDLGRAYSIHSGQFQAIGVTLQKNSLGVMALVCSLSLIWDILEFILHSRRGQYSGTAGEPGHPPRRSRMNVWVGLYAPLATLLMGVWLLRTSDSKTSIACLALGGSILCSICLPVFRKRIAAMGFFVFAGIGVAILLDSLFGIKDWLVQFMGRDLTFTGRTDVWRELLALNTDPVFGTGFCSFWSDPHYRSRLPEWVEASAHNGYLETYIDGGFLALSLLAVLMVASIRNVNRQLAVAGNYALMRLAILLITLTANYSESNFGRMTPLGFAFLLAVFDLPKSVHRKPGLQAPSRPELEPSTLS